MRRNGKVNRIKQFPSQENDDIFHMFDQIKVSRIPFVNRQIASFAWRVT